jgi:hypothetical protein
LGFGLGFAATGFGVPGAGRRRRSGGFTLCLLGGFGGEVLPLELGHVRLHHGVALFPHAVPRVSAHVAGAVVGGIGRYVAAVPLALAGHAIIFELLVKRLVFREVAAVGAHVNVMR